METLPMPSLDEDQSEKPMAQDARIENADSASSGTSPVVSHIRSINLPKIIPFNELCRCGDEIWIEYEKQIYRLRKTKQGKLILTK
jgi:hemin uptake protein HemP